MTDDFRYWVVTVQGTNWRSGDLTGELIRCKDCVYAFPADAPRTCTRSMMRIKAYGFCAWATKRRRTDDQ